MPDSQVSHAYRFSGLSIALLVLLGVAILAMFDEALVFMVQQWNEDEFSHGYLIPFICAFLLWQRRTALQRLEFHGSWTGLAIVAAGIGLEVVGRLSALFPLQHLALLVVVGGLVLALTCWCALRLLAMPLGVLVFMIPLPNMLLNPLSSQLQLMSSSLGVQLMRLLGIAAYLEGNVIDLGSYRLEVAEACSGLRYLLPLMTLGFLMACVYRAPLWRRALVFLSSIPITLLVNSLRIAAIGFMVDRWGIGMAEGLLHEVQGWMMFMVSVALMLLEILWLHRISGDRRPLRALFDLEPAAPHAAAVRWRRRAAAAPLLAAAALTVACATGLAVLPSPRPVIPSRDTFTTFPSQIAGWSGRRSAMESVYLDGLKLDDYLLADYTRAGGLPVNLYLAWYDTQSAGRATHSPRACLPGGGWRILSLRQASESGLQIGSQPLRFNGAVIGSGDQTALVYYWFQQRGRVVTNEYLVKWYLLVDSLFRHRTDGALIRLTAPVPVGTPIEVVDRELSRFTAVLVQRLARYVPG